MKRSKVLIVSYVFPPMAAVGVFRVIKMCKFLPQFGWEPSVLTVKEGFNYAYDHASLERLDKDLKIYRSKYFSPFEWRDQKQMAGAKSEMAPSGRAQIVTIAEPSLSVRVKRFIRNMLSLPDSQSFWVVWGVLKGLKAVRENQIEVILSTSPPATSHLVAYLISLFSGRPLVLDFRDLWTQNEGYESRNLPILFKKIDRFIEKKALTRAKAVVAATDGFCNLLKENNPDLDPEKFYPVTNGIDPDDFKQVVFPTEKNQKFYILHMGSLYGHRNPEFFFKVLSEWHKRRPELIDQVNCDFIGNTPGYENALKGTSIEPLVTFRGHIPQQEILALLWQADLLLLILGFNKNAAKVMPAKLFEYICTGRPILGFVPEGMAAEKIRQYQRGLPVTAEDIDSAVAFLDEQFDHWQKRPGPMDSTFDLPDEFDRKKQIGKLAGALDQIRVS